MASVATDVGARGEGAAVDPEALTNIPNQAVTPEFLVYLVKTPGLALKVVEHEVARRELFTEKKDSEFLPKHQGDGGSTVVASNVWNPDRLKKLNLCGKDVSNTFVLLVDGNKKLLADFILDLKNPEAVKNTLQGLVYNERTRFSEDDDANNAVHAFLASDEISSEYKGNGKELVQVASLVEPPLKRFTDLLIPSAPVEILEVPAGAGAVDVSGPSDRVIGNPVSANDAATVDADTASVGQGGSNTGEKAAPKQRDNGEDTDSQDSLRRELSDLLSGRAQFIRREVSPSEEADSSNGNREIEEDDQVELVKEWLRKQFSSERLGVIREVVPEDSSESKTATGGDSRSDEGSTEERGRYKLSDFASVLDYSDKSKEELLSSIKERWISARQESGDSIKSSGNGSSFINTYRISDGKTYIEPCSREFEKGFIDQKLIDKFYDVKEGEIGDCYGITELAEIDINTDGRTFTVKSKGQLFLPQNHPYFNNKTASPS